MKKLMLMLFAFAFAGSQMVMAQGVTITGTTNDAGTGESLPGVTVQVQGTTIGAISGPDGTYRINNVPAGSTTLVFSFVGYRTQNVAISGRSVVDVAMVEEVTALDEVVVVGYGTQIKSSVTGAISSVQSSELQNMKVTTVADALQGRVSGAFVTSESGEPGSGSNVYLRGPISISGGNPLYVVDGVPIENLGYDFNMDDIESISVLKDASAASIYGAKAAAGVILVTTKRGGSQTPEISISANYGVRNVYNLPELFQRDDYIEAKALAGHDVVDLYGPESGWSSLPDTDWFDEMYKQGIEQDYSISMAGGGDVSTYYLSGNYNSIEGTLLNNWINRYSFRINSDHQINKALKFSESIYLKAGTENPSSRPGNGYLSFRSTPVMPVYDENNLAGGWGLTPKGYQGANRVAGLLANYARNKSYAANISGSLDVRIIEGLHFKALLGTTIEYVDSYFYQEPYEDGAFAALEDFTKGTGKDQQYIATYTLSYNNTFGAHRITALLGYEARKRDFNNVVYGNRDAFVAEPQSATVAYGIQNLTADFFQNDVLDRILSQFGRIEYDYMGKYLLTANIRRDGYGSKFGPENRYGVFPGASVGWILSQENFMSQFSFITLLKIRAGYGVLGNAVGQDFAYTSFYQPGWSYDWRTDGGATRETALALSDQLPNAEIQWESVATTNIGVDLSLWTNRLTVNLDYYSRQTKKMLYDVQIAPSAGVGPSVAANIGQMSNKGFEVQIIHQNDIGDFSYDVSVNAGFNKNELISLDPDLDRLYLASGNIGNGESGTGFYGAVFPCRSEPGQPLGQFYGLQTKGIYATDAAAGTRPIYSGYTPQAGDLIYVDQNNDGVIDVNDYVYIGNPWPKLTYGFSLGASWKNFDIKALFNGTLGNDIYNAFESWEHNFFSDYNTTAMIYETSFFAGNGLTDKPRAENLSNPDRNKNWGLVSDYHVQPGSYLRLNNLQIGYTIPSQITSKVRMNFVKVFFSADNLFTITKYKGMDPEIPAQREYGGILAQGLDFTSQRYPNSRVISVGINVTF